ncbi:UDP-N-acetylmuramate--L-alanine ligase [Lyngbya confervoides]|uniref:UDP-N-acetylmuramate--L-alanine ligase n=1 Tax=Lyngbya confervoides BDU141951 TaxID=1574623 RepID=A0ABD4SY46_9CYAN|nr:UDP-N-acetylmuramate--L-alanine ligase [Lyngbya confervoides BDU141951]
MSALAYILAQRGIPVSGSDVRENRVTQQLETLGIQIFQSQVAENLDHFRDLSPQIICSTAIKATNLEYQAAVARNYSMFHRSDLLAAFIKAASRSIAVAGTHGKTTTSSIIGHLLVKADLDPTVIIGGEVGTWGGNARSGHGPFLVAEADESDGSLVKFQPWLSVITNIELDHPDHYQSLEEVIETFQALVERSHTTLVCLDCERIRDRLLPQYPHHSFLTYGLNPDFGADYTVTDVTFNAQGTSAQVWEQGQPLGYIQVPLLGQHNLANALAGVAIARQCGVNFEKITAGLTSFGGAKRRFEIRGEAGGIRLVDDYAHHPSEVAATLASARLQVTHTDQWKRVIAVFQPHRYSRIYTFLEQFSQSFQDADQVIVTDVYSAGEPNTVGITPADIHHAISQQHPNVIYQARLEDVTEYLANHAEPGDLILFLGAGNLNSVIPGLLDVFDNPSHLSSAVHL